MKYILVLQWPGTNEADLDALIAMEDLLEAALPEAHGFVDGHDFGAGQMNIFVHTDRPLEAFRDAKTSLSHDPRWSGARAAYRPAEGDRYVLVWPATLEGFSVS
ncbi:hypothetical protein [Arthrobacter sp. FW306-2-2C-D06B]|uniref:hypothetical protein n=1 Tax=Arthrobacter sp. FW306-2-2C-D06B TaxID=2879618 RepID=UPI001F31B26A|nr:hypothetical protein [Arthrobacter sp. FW306-2-2C-D06B]UKA56921.1 hypothetical protein LFT47_11370 [Arthrobacter sp. FW306-2-2C-D06B]